MTTRPGTAPASPCIGTCRIDPASGLCEGCLRTLDEIAAWSRMGDAARRDLMEKLPQRRPTPPNGA